MTTKNKIFFAEAMKGYTKKVLIDVLSGSIQRGVFEFNKDGIFLRNRDPKNTILFDLALTRENFRLFKCTEHKVISINLKHTQRLLRNVKKKDSVAFFIDKDRPGFLGITIRPEGSSKKSSRFETSYTVYQEEKDYVPLKLPDEGYGYPMVIETSDFQKVKRLTSDSKVGKLITVRMQKSNYLSFFSDNGDVYNTELGFGELVDDPDELEEEKRMEENGVVAEEEEEEAPKKSKAKTKVKVPEKKKKDDKKTPKKNKDGYDEEEESEIKCLYEAQFYNSMFNLLVKLPGLANQMQFYAPTIPHYPLRIKIHAGTLGYLQIYLKEIEQVIYEETLQKEQTMNKAVETPVTKPPKKKTK